MQELGQRERVLMMRVSHQCHKDGRESVRMAQNLVLQHAIGSSLGRERLGKDFKLQVFKYPRNKTSNSVRDFMGHGTHTSSTAVGKYVPGVSHFGYARGTARGVAPAAHFAMYKVSWATTKSTSATDLLAGMNQAILDGVDIMSLSLGIDQPPYFKDTIAIASLSAIEKGIFVVCSDGND